MNSLMTHMVAYYPDRETSLEVAKGLLHGGASFLEIQFPFSDPTADGPAIQAACTSALEAGFTLERGFSLLEEICRISEVPVYIMSYASLVFTGGVDRFLQKVKSAGGAGVIVPDLPPGSDEGLYSGAAALGLHAVPVVSTNILEGRLERIRRESPEFVYAALRAGTTGSRTTIDGDLKRFLRHLSLDMGFEVLGGFGIRSKEQISQLAPLVHSCVVGSYLVEQITAIHESGGDMAGGVSSVTADLI